MDKLVTINEKVDSLKENYGDYLDFYSKSSVKAKAKGITNEDIWGLGAQLEQFENYKQFLEQTGSAADLSVLPVIALDVITAASAQSPVPLMASIQPIDEEKGNVYFQNVYSRTQRGNINDHDMLVSGKTGRKKIGQMFTGEFITGDSIGTTVGGTTNYANIPFSYPQVKPRTVEITIANTDVKMVDDGSGILLGKGGNGTVDYNTGEISFELLADPGAEAILATYSTDMEILNEIPTVMSGYDSISVQARTYALN